MSEFKPGDVALVTSIVNGSPDESVRVHTATGPGWTNGINWVGREIDRVEARPLVVIDPEDREQVDRLFDAIFLSAFRSGLGRNEINKDFVQAALREFANPTPPKPDEPMGLGAVVEDNEGVRWVRFKSFELKPWRQTHLPGHCDRELATAYFADINAVTILSEGVTR